MSDTRNKSSAGGEAEVLEQTLRRDLVSGRLATDMRLPSERQMVGIYSTTRITLREALFHMEIDGLIYRENRRGWYVSGPRLIYNPLQRSNFHVMVAQQERRAETELVDAVSAPAPDDICVRMKCALGTEFWRVRRRRRIDGRLVLFVEHYLSKTVFPNILQHDLRRSLTSIYQEYYGIDYGPAYFEINPIALRGMIADKLHCTEGAYGLKITRVNCDLAGRLIDCDLEYWRHNAISIQIDAVPHGS
ncbi:MFS transporter [Phyllobacterium phragmitis]|uniref:MFS transporter n=2 Tax=Phyllobacterium phragmitis TaxID=2670329 RepID=A0A2S9IPX6_9HYPH|nr:MFS transporter [Phyllobacterium phragmitis]